MLTFFLDNILPCRGWIWGRYSKEIPCIESPVIEIITYSVGLAGMCNHEWHDENIRVHVRPYHMSAHAPNGSKGGKQKISNFIFILKLKSNLIQ